MKKLITLLLLLSLLFSSIHAQQTLLGVCSSGGNQFGTIIQYHPGDTIINNKYSLKGICGSPPGETDLMLVGNVMYGATSAGGSLNQGVFYKFDIGTGKIVKIWDFNQDFAFAPIGNLLLANNGKIYCTTGNGNTILEYDISTNTFIKKLIYDPTNDGNLTGNLIQASNGKIYGMTSNNGILHSNGMIFEYNEVTNNITPIYYFNGLDGANGKGPLIETSNGLLYGITNMGGSNNSGVIFEFNLNDSTFSKKFDFGNTLGANPNYSKIHCALNGKIYGTTDEGGQNNCGVLFEFDPINNLYTKKYDFNFSDGKSPVGKVCEFSNGILMGVTKDGGANNLGVIYQFNLITNSFTKKVDLESASGGKPYNSIIKTSFGKYYVAPSAGGVAGYGTILQYNTVTNSVKRKISFGASEGSSCNGGLIKTSNGKYYGMTAWGGLEDYGVIFEYDINSNTYTKKVDLNTQTGGRPKGRFLEANNGKLYGLTESGGIFPDGGTIIEYDPLSNICLNKYSFSSLSGYSPGERLIQAANGLFYGLASNGGIHSVGVIFSFDSNTGIYTKLHDFDPIEGASPLGSLLELPNGDLLGLTNSGGIFSVGTLFKFNIYTNLFTKLKDFQYPGSGPQSPLGSLMLASNNIIYGVSPGGINGSVIFEYDNLLDSIIVKADFPAIDGSIPIGDLFEASNSKLYGMTFTGGTFQNGVIFEYDLNSSTFSKKMDLNMNETGGYPWWSSFVATDCSAPGILPSGPTGICQGDSVLLNSTGAPGSTFQWKRNGNIIPGATNQSFMATQQGKYTVTVTDPVCSNTLTSNPVKVTIICLPPIDPGQKSMLSDDDEMTSNLVVSETSQNVYSINCTHLQGSGFTLSFYNTLGQLMLSKKGTIQNSEMHELIDCSALSSGMYILKVKTEKEELLRKQFIRTSQF